MKNLFLSAMMLTGVIAFAQEQPTKTTQTQPAQTTTTTQTTTPAQQQPGQVPSQQPTADQKMAAEKATIEADRAARAERKNAEATKQRDDKTATESKKAQPAKKSN